MKKLLILASALYLQAAFVQAEVVVIGNTSITSTLSASEVKNLFLGKRKSLPDGTKIAVIEQAKDSPVREAFHSKFTKKTQAQLSSYWTRLVFTGKGKMPEEVSNSEEIINMISTNPGLIGYIDSSEVTDGIVVLAK
ncbi:phosphate ABC transporter substrate-binding protein [Colwellia sp. 1_MG-2023]|uniref:phosphate ABC transporter substrate-binding protein n=1 Tax=unclassified Colwellia TaxID=196834 RepID=UPI001C08FCD4|nr:MULTISPECIES: phosphate ABC transporter substrate-binding protein [unclassified Colwellia]MBU2924830.1 phosphate ABC transporter substrate-binding protein [Colwellia sp. C2M11]MDO6654065.1 phosphate ABC transporter substrate-binding protein [Colwellia sp. 3_MG-2023]MDO6665483.1 phosphate ABC transporter substrate-binding protein [Colwellia sp. 2_MG-2023]MDO6689758.1 phosphate ABC transporter substrate-binding protein [Colwellia sp. 1_MG-2023]